MMTTAQSEWQPTHMRLPLAQFDVHVWRGAITTCRNQLPGLTRILSAEERERAERFLLPELRERFVMCRATLRHILASYLEITPAEIEFGYLEHGKPFVAGSRQNNSIEFSVSHSNGLLLVAVTSGRQIGVDVEHIRPGVDVTGIARRYFSSREFAAIEALPSHLQVEAFFTCWTRKESYLKATGFGLSDPLDQFDVSIDPDKPAALLHHLAKPSECHRWTMQSLNPGVGYAGALTVESGARTIHQWDWS